MNTKEVIRERTNLSVAPPMAARAVAICEGCPLAKFCATKAVSPCESPQVRTLQIEHLGGDYGGSSLDKPVEFSYRKQLMDDTVPFVMADLRKKKEAQVAQTRRVVSRQNIPSQTGTPKPTIASKRTGKPPLKVGKPEVKRTESADILADILVSMLGVSSMSTSLAKKKV